MAKPPPRIKPKKKTTPVKLSPQGEIDYKDVTLLRKFISDRGKI
ncbi:MAG: 30S ribosomal protein S18, partial [Bifidobacteriaceae bacterium]|nr:30S ribosomal protein S18 [Bifidobacteriaceae bacterium]